MAIIYNPQGHFLDKRSWSAISHRRFVNALLENDAESVGLACREIMRNAICFMREVHTARDKIPDICLELGYNTCFINTIYSFDGMQLDKKTLKNLESLVNLDSLTRYFENYVYHCKRTRGEGLEHKEALKLLARLAEILRCEAMALTTTHYRSLRYFLEGPINDSLISAIGSEIEDCINYINNCIRREPGTVLPLDSIPCDAILSKIAGNFGIPFTVSSKVKTWTI